MVASLPRAVVLVLVVVASFVAAGLANAQPRPVSDSTGFLPGQDYVSTETGMPFFATEDAALVDKAFKDMRDAIAKCYREAYESAKASIYRQGYLFEQNFARIEENRVVSNNGPYPPKDAGPLSGKKGDREMRLLYDAYNMAPPFPENCTPPKYGTTKYGYFELAAVGGAMIPLNSTGAVTGVDTFFGAGNFLIDNRTNGASSSAVPLLGARVRATWQDQAANPSTMPYAKNYWERIGNWVETGVQTSFGAQSFIQPFGGVSTTPQGFGSNTVKENFQVPILIGVGLPITSPGQTPIFLDLYGGITLDSWTQTLQGRESGAPGGPGLFGQNQRFTVDPTFGVGVRVPVGDIGFGLPIIFGVNAELQFRLGSVVTATSANFPSETYYGTVNPTANMAIMGRIGIPFGGR